MPTVGLSMIVRNGGEDLRLCLASARSLVDQIVVADTGSTDETRRIAQEFGAQVVEFPWTRHYAEARNESLRHVTTEWVLVLDVDEELSEEAAGEIPKLLHCGEETGGFRLLQRSYWRDRFRNLQGRLSTEFRGRPERAAALGARSYLDNPLCRLFRRRPGFSFRGRIHEIVEHQLIAEGAGIADTPLVLHHYGELAEDAARQEKQARYRELLRLALEESPADANLWVQLAVTERVYFQQPEEALRCYGRAAALGYAGADAWIGIAQICMEKGEPEVALEAVRRLGDGGGEGILKLELSGDALHGLGRLAEARSMYDAALRRARLDASCLATGRAGRIESKLGYTEARLGMQEGIGRMRRAIEACPDAIDQHDRLVKALVLLRREEEAAEAAEEILKYFLSEKIFARAVALNLRAGRRDRAECLLEAGRRLFPESGQLSGMRASWR